MRFLLAFFLATAALLSSAKSQGAEPFSIGEGLDDCAVYRFGTGAHLKGTFAEYVQTVGRRVAKAAGYSGAESLRVIVMDSAIQNAFACPSGIYISREYLANLNDEGELATLLGHEIGHKTAGHVVPAEVQFLRKVLGLRHKFSPADETEADKLGVQYMIAAGYDPASAISEMNANKSWREASGIDTSRTSVFNTHPSTAVRLEKVTAQATSSGKLGQGLRNRDEYLRQLDGLRMGDDPAGGKANVNGGFLHPALRIAFQYPALEEFHVINGDAAITISAPQGVAQFTGTKITGTSLDAVVANVFRKYNPNQNLKSPITHSVVNSMPTASFTQRATYLGRGEEVGSVQVDMSIFAYQFDKDMYYYFVSATPVGSGFGIFNSTFKSFRKIDATTAERFNKSYVLKLHTVKEGETLQSLASQMAYGQQLPFFLRLNNMQPNDVLRAGQLVKLVVQGTPSVQ